MPRFKVRVDGEPLVHAMARLNAAGIPTIGFFPAYFVEQGPPANGQLDRLSAVVEAENAKTAEARVRDELPDADYGVKAEPFD
jgi:hypothetical protein